MKRRALVVVNSVGYGEASKSLPKGVVARIADEVDARLASLEDEWRFRVTCIKDQVRARAAEIIRRNIKAAGSDGSALLFYYFGHALSPEDADELYLYFKDSEPYDLPTMLRFSDIADWMRQYGVAEVLVVMDCCHAGMVARNLRLLDAFDGKFFLMASVTAKHKALVDYSGEQPMGVFTRFFLKAFGSPHARAHGRDVTFLSFFRHIESRVRADSRQKPYYVDNGLSNELFFRQTTQPVILPHVSPRAPKKSIYKRLYAICAAALKRDFPSTADLYRLFERRRTQEFLQPTLLPNGTHDYTCISVDAFSNYVGLARELGVLEPDDPVRLTAAGKRMARSEGARYNEVLLELVGEVWAKHGVKLEHLEDAIGQRLKANSIPSSEGIFSDIALAKRLSLPKYMFKVLLDLTAYAGALEIATDKTFFLSTPEAGD